MKKETTAPTGAEPRILSADEVREIAERAEKATPGPWSLEVDEYEESSGQIIIPEINRLLHDTDWADPKDWQRDLDNAEFISRSRTDIPNLCYTVERLRAALISLKAEPMGNDEWGIKCIEDHNAIIDEALGGAPEPPNNDAEIARLARRER